MLTYGSIRGYQLVVGSRPLVSSYMVRGEKDPRSLVDLNKHDFKIAFSVQKIEKTELKPIDDRNFVEWQVFFQEQKQGISTYENINIHKCSEEDFDQFYDIDES